MPIAIAFKATTKILISRLVHLPGSLNLLKKIALLPARYKSQPLERICALAIKQINSGDILFDTNLGLPGIHARIPARKASYVFGRPRNNISERATIELAVCLCQSASAFVDIGAHEGVFSLAVWSHRCADPSFQIHAYEPDPDLNERIALAFKRNGIVGTTNLEAVSNASGLVSFYKNLSDDLSGSISDYFSFKHDVLKCSAISTTISAILKKNDLKKAIIKVDIEGAGEKAWLGAREELGRIDALIIEMLEPEIKAKLPNRIIDETGWNAFYIQDYKLIESLSGEFKYVEPFYNWLFTKHSPAQLSALLDSETFSIQSNMQTQKTS